MPVFFIAAQQVQNGTVTITGPLLSHLRTSLRIQVGETIWLGDERRRRYLIEVTRIGRHDMAGCVLEAQEGPTPSGPTVTVGQALLKGDRMDWVIQKATELGVAALVPLMTAHTVVRPRTIRLAPQQERWQRIALEAAQQAERWEVPTVSAPWEPSKFFKVQSPAALKLILSARGPGQTLASIPLPCGPESLVVIAVGPEGGWTSEELAQALECGFLPVTLGNRILRAETATLAALSVLQSRLGELG